MTQLPTHIDPTREEQDKLLFTPGPLTTSYLTKQAMMVDLGSRDGAFMRVIKQVQFGLLKAANLSPKEYITIIMQGSGTYGVESVISSVVPKKTRGKKGGLLIVANGAYGLRIGDICKAHGNMRYKLLDFPETDRPDAKAVEAELARASEAGDAYSHLVCIHSETTSGIINDLVVIGSLAHKYGASFIVDAMSSFGGVPVDFETSHIDFLVSSSNKCIEGVPGFAFIIARRKALAATRGNADTLSLDIHKQVAGLEATGQFRFTPPIHSLLAFNQGLKELALEGGIEARSKRYHANMAVIHSCMKKLGFQRLIRDEIQGCIITSYRYPTDSNWNFTKFYNRLNDLGCVIYPGKLSKADCFRIGHIGRLFPSDCERLCRAIIRVCKEMKTAKYYQPQAKL